MRTNLDTANDNVPLGNNKPSDTAPISHHPPGQASGRAKRARSVITVSKYSPVKPSVRIHYGSVPAPVSTQYRRGLKANRQKTGKFPVYLLLLFWALMVAGIARFAGGLSDNLLSGSSLAYATGGLGLLSLLLASTARRRGAKISHSIGIASACVCAGGIIWYYWQLSGATISAEFLGLGLAITCLILAKIWRSPFLLHLSFAITIGWSAYSFLNMQVSELAWLFPALWSMQMFLALEFRFKRTITLSVFTGLLWIGVNLLLLT